MLTEKEMKSLKKGTYPNHVLRDIFGKKQGFGKSARMTLVEDGKDFEGQPNLVMKLINFFTGKEVKPTKVRTQRTTNK